MTQRFLRLTLILVLVVLSACANGSDSTDVSSNSESFTGVVPLSVAERVTVVDAKTTSLGSSSVEEIVPLNADFSALAEYYYIPSGTPFYTDSTRIFVNERSASIFRTINNILCHLNRTGYKEMMNKGFYIALTDDNKCDQEGGSSDGQPDFLQWTMQSIRLDNSSPHQIEGWILPDVTGKEEIDIRLEFKGEITEAKSDSNPFGIFRIDFGMHWKPQDQPWQLAMKLFIRSYRDEETGKVLVEFGSTDAEGGDEDIEVAVMNRGTDNLSGSGSVFTTDYIYNSVSGNYEQTPVNYNFAFNDTHFRRQDIVNSSDIVSDSCYFRNSFNEEVWSYGLYDVNGDRLDLFRGFPFRYVYNATDYYGYISDWGYYVYEPDIAPLNSGDTIYRDDSSTEAGTAYELFQAPGKLTKHFTVLKSLGNYLNMPLNYSYFDRQLWQWQYIQIAWDGQNLNTVAVYNSNTYTYDPVTPTPLDLTSLTSPTLNVWSNSLGSLEIRFTGCTTDTSTGYTLYDCSNPGAAATTEVATFQAHTVRPDDPLVAGELSNGLLCFKYCPDAAQVKIVNSPDMYYPQSKDYSMMYQENVDAVSGILNTITYSFGASNMLLLDDGAGGVDVVLEQPNGNTYLPYGTGPLIANTTANREKLRCDSDPKLPGYGSTCADKAETLPVYYTWATGTYSGYWLTVLYDLSTDNLVTFDEPLHMNYVHKGAGDYYNQTLSLEYSDFGDLWGIPSMCVDPDTWDELSDTDCYTAGGWYVRAFNIPTGGKLTYVDEQGTEHEYFAKALEKEQYMLKLDDTTPCEQIVVDTFTLPDPNTDWLDPAMGEALEVDAPPAVIDGEIQKEATATP